MSLLITFSGMDGAGKSTQIENLCRRAASYGLRVRQLAFWDDVVVLKPWREGFVHKVLKSEQGIGAPGKPVNRRDKNVRKWYLTVARHLLYLLDALNLRRVVARARRGNADVLVMDRYLYDQLANLPLERRFARVFVRAVARLVPRPDIAYVLDADPQAARARKPEYPVEFLEESRRRYLGLAALLKTTTVIPPLPLDDAMFAVDTVFRGTLAESRSAPPQQAVHPKVA